MNGPNAVTSAPLLALSVFGQQECGCSTRNFRNIVLNVASDNIDPDDAESVVVSQLGEHLHALSRLPHLMQFYKAIR